MAICNHEEPHAQRGLFKHAQRQATTGQRCTLSTDMFPLALHLSRWMLTYLPEVPCNITLVCVCGVCGFCGFCGFFGVRVFVPAVDTNDHFLQRSFHSPLTLSTLIVYSSILSHSLSFSHSCLSFAFHLLRPPTLTGNSLHFVIARTVFFSLSFIYSISIRSSPPLHYRHLYLFLNSNNSVAVLVSTSPIAPITLSSLPHSSRQFFLRRFCERGTSLLTLTTDAEYPRTQLNGKGREGRKESKP